MKRILVLLFGMVLLPANAKSDDQLHRRPEYNLHTGDVIVLNYRYTPEFNQTVTVQPDGYVNLNIV
jgi:polysaccharide export outer membrane protein